MCLLLISLGLIFCMSLLFYISSCSLLLYFRSTSVSNGLENMFHFKNDMHVCFHASAPNILIRNQPSIFSLYNCSQICGINIMKIPPYIDHLPLESASP